jgi:hypothetical protein
MPCIITNPCNGVDAAETNQKSRETKQKEHEGGSHLCAEFLDISLLALKGQRHDTRDVHLGAVDVHVEAELNADGLDVLQTLLVVGTSTADPDLDLVLNQDGGELADGANDTLESGGNVGEVGNTTTDEEDLALGVGGGAQHQIEDGLSVRVCLACNEVSENSRKKYLEKDQLYVPSEGAPEYSP